MGSGFPTNSAEALPKVNRGLAEFSDTALPATSLGFAPADRVDGGTSCPRSGRFARLVEIGRGPVGHGYR